MSKEPGTFRAFASVASPPPDPDSLEPASGRCWCRFASAGLSVSWALWRADSVPREERSSCLSGLSLFLPLDLRSQNPLDALAVRGQLAGSRHQNTRILVPVSFLAEGPPHSCPPVGRVSVPGPSLRPWWPVSDRTTKSGPW